MRLQTGVLRLSLWGNPSSSVGCTIWFVGFGSRFERHDHEWVLDEMIMYKALKQSGYSLLQV